MVLESLNWDPPSSTKLLLRGVTMEYMGVFVVIYEMINDNDWNKIVNAKLFFKVVQLIK